MPNLYNPYDNILKVVDHAASLLGYPEKDYAFLKYPERGEGLHACCDG